MAIEVRNIVKRFGSFAALDNVDLKVADGELLALLGPSGSGKTTLLRIIAGLDWPDSGEVAIDGENALSRGASERQVGFVFQHYALFRHMTVFENVAFGLRVQPRAIRKDEATIRARVKNLLDLVQLDWLANRYPSQLSGGQRQRIALARHQDQVAPAPGQRLGQGQAQVLVSLLQRGAATAEYVHCSQRLGLGVTEQRGGVLQRIQNKLSHAVMQQGGDGGQVAARAGDQHVHGNHSQCRWRSRQTGRVTPASRSGGRADRVAARP